MIPFKTTPDQVLNLAKIVLAMERAGLDRTFIRDADELARTDQGVYDLMALWLGEDDVEERGEIIADIQESLDDYADAPAHPGNRIYDEA